VDERDDALVVRSADGKEHRIPRAQIVEVKPPYDEEVLEALSPEQPEEYYTLGAVLVARQDDPEAREMGRRLLLLSARLDPERLFTESYRKLADAAETDGERLGWLRRILVRDPLDSDVRAEYVATRGRVDGPLQGDLQHLVAGLEGFLNGSPQTAAAELSRVRSPELAQIAQAHLKEAERLTSCPLCHGSRVVTCRTCLGYGAIPCSRCNGTGVSTRRGYGGRGYRRCTRCDQVGAVVCPTCLGSGYVPCSCTRGNSDPVPSPATAALLRSALRDARSRMDRNARFWEADHSDRVPNWGSFLFAKDIDYSRTVFRSGRWVAP
jgi:hypothetical protein